VYWRRRDSESDPKPLQNPTKYDLIAARDLRNAAGNRKNDAMNAIDTRQKIFDAVDANFDAQLAATKDFVAIPSAARKDRARI
jgi:hypothetical protein